MTHPPRRIEADLPKVPPPPAPEPPRNYLAEDIRRILAELDADPNSAHLAPAIRERLLRLTENVERLGAAPVEVDASTELTASFGLEPEQEVRAEALHATTKLLLHPERPLVPAREVATFAAVLADWIRAGSRP